VGAEWKRGEWRVTSNEGFPLDTRPLSLGIHLAQRRKGRQGGREWIFLQKATAITEMNLEKLRFLCAFLFIIIRALRWTPGRVD
jgi:hypothetical protein